MPDGAALHGEASVAAGVVRGAAEYLLRSHGAESVRGLASVDLSDSAHYWDNLASLGLEKYPDWPHHTRQWASLQTPWEEPMKLERGGRLIEFSASSAPTMTRGARVELTNGRLEIELDGREGGVNLAPLVALASPDGPVTLEPEQRWMPLYDGTQRVGEVVLRDVTLEREGDGAWTINYASGFAVFY